MKKNNQIKQDKKVNLEGQDLYFSNIEFTLQTENYVKKIKQRVANLKEILYHWSLKSGHLEYYGTKDIQILKKYINYQHEHYEYDQFDSSFQFLQLQSQQINFGLIQSEQIIYKSFDLFPKARWPIRFDSKFVAKIKDYSLTQVYYVLGFIYYLADGNFQERGKRSYGYARPIVTKTISFNRFFTVKLFRQKNLFVHIGVQKIPVVKQGVIKRYEYINYMNFLDILGDMYVQNKNKLEQRMKVFTDKIFNDVAKRDHSQEIKADQKFYNKDNQYFFTQYVNEYTEKLEYYSTDISPNKICLPIIFQTNYISTSEGNSMIFDNKMKRWISQDHLNFIQRKKIAQYQKQINDSMIERFVDFQSAKTLVELLTKIPNFKVNLTEQEKDVIGENGNVLAIGRSGTGKTTCAVLRLFSIEMLFKIRVSLYKKKFSDTVKDVRCGSDDIDQAFGLHCIFLTASPVLTHQIQRYYKKLTDNIKTQLQKKKKKVGQEKKKEREESQKTKKQRQFIEQKKQVSFEDLNQSSRVEEHSMQQQNNKAIHQAPENLDEQIVPEDLKKQKSAQVLQQEKQLNEEFKDIKLQQDINNQNFDEKQEDIDEIKQQFQENIKKFNSLFDLTEKDYPGFFTVKSFIMMIDGVMSKPFFIRSKNQIINKDSKASWHNENKGVMMIEDYFRNADEEKIQIDDIEQQINYSDEEQLQHEYLRQIQLRQNKQKQNLTKKLKKNKVLSFEVDYDYFLIHFWPRVVKKYYCSRNITAHLVWTEIYSTIKGSAAAHQFPGQYLSQHAYMNSSANTFLTVQQKLDIYQTFCQYQRWKINVGGYDIMDTVNYILNRIRFAAYQGPQIHYVMIDEVQDLPHAIVYLLSKVASYGVFYSGDTAQTIAKGVGFRFCDLKTLFNSNTFDASLTLKAPIIKHLTVNFRSHNNILQLANSIVSSIQILFPKTIDKMKKQISDLLGPKPMILSTSDEQLLFYVLCGGEEKSTQQGHNAIKKSPLQFGCDQVIIVRDQQSKQKVPSMLQHALCLTIYQAKGLEFNDVILFNFFSQSPCQDKWSALKTLQVITQQIPKQQYQTFISRHKPQQIEKQQVKIMQQKKQNQDLIQQIQQVAVQEIFNKEKNVFLVKKLAQRKKAGFINDINDYAELCSELKLLYTAITRPRKTLIIYDDKQTHSRITLQKIWERLDVVELITKQIVLQSNKKGTETEEVKIFKRIVASTDSQSWKQQGLKMYARGYFDQAMKCFQRSGHKQLYKKAEANKNADQATKKLIQIQSERNAIKQKFHTYQNMSSSQLSKIKSKLKLQQARSIRQFLFAAQIFEDMMIFKQAGQCYYSGKKFESAFECFCKAFMNKQAAQSLEMQNKFREAAQYYQKDQSYLKVIECLDLVNEWTLILQKIHKFAHKMSDYQRQALLKKYSALALQQLVYDIQFENQQEQQKPENNRVEVIQQKESDQQEDWDSEQDPELAAEREYQRKLSEASNSNPSRKVSEISEQNLVQIKESAYQTLGEQNKQRTQSQKLPKQQQKKNEQEASFSQLNYNNQTEKVQNSVGLKSVEKSFGHLNNSSQAEIQVLNESQKADIISLQSSFGDLNQLQPDLQSIKSMVDPDDIWVKNSISQIGHKLHSEYSVIDQDQNYNLNAKIIKTKGNIFVQDQIMRKIVKIVSIINSSVSQFFKQFKGYQSLITLNKNQQAEQNKFDNRPEISQFEDIDPKFINIILDTLQSFKLFKLCLFVCNRYHMPTKAGRYLLSLGLKYSTNCISNNFINPILLAPSNFRKTEVQKGILASIALHAIYENVNSDFLKIKVTYNEQANKNSLGIYFIQGLILQGLYKKAVFMVNPHQSFKILSNYNDFQAYSSLYHQKILRKQQVKESIEFPLNVPKSQDQKGFTKMLLKKVLFEANVVYRFQSVSLRYYKEFTQNYISHEKLQRYTIPNYLPFTKLLVENKTQLIKQFKHIIVNGYSILQKGNSIQILDLIGALMIITHKEQCQQELVQKFNVEEFLQLYRCSNHIQIALKKYTGANALKIIQAVFFMHQCYRINYCKSMNFINDIYCFVHRTSTVANQLVENHKIQTSHFAYFFQQDYNLLLAKSSKISGIILKKYQLALVKLYSKKRNQRIQKPLFLPQDYREYQQQHVLKIALGVISESISLTKRQKRIVNRSLKPIKKKQLKPSFDFKYNGGRDNYIVNLHQSQQSQQEIDHQKYQKLFRFYRPNFYTKLKYLAPALIQLFNEHCKHSSQIIEGHQLYCAGLNNLYREYVTNEGGYNLFDAVQFKRFNRVDLYAENILSVIDNMSLFAKHNYIAQNLILLMLQYRSLEEPKGFSLQVTNSQLKYFENLKFKAIKDKNEISQNLSRQQIHSLLINKQQCIFVHQNKLVSEMDCQQIGKLICDYLQILKEEQISQYVNFPTVILSLVVNLSSNDNINDSLRKVINGYVKYWKFTSLYQLAQCKGINEYTNKRKALLLSQTHQFIEQKLHRIQVKNTGNLKKCIEQSEFDYQVQGRIIEAKKKAAKKIMSWWKAKRNELRQKDKSGTYFQLAVQAERLPYAKKKETVKDIRLMKLLYPNRNIYTELNFLLQTEEQKDELLSFLLTNTINSSLDFHFILLSLNKIQECRHKYFEYCAWDQEEIHEFSIEDIKEEIDEMQKTINIWKKDQKWLRDKNINLKKKKVFEVKWMTKNLVFSGLLKKRAGLKRQQLLQSKKKLLKRTK